MDVQCDLTGDDRLRGVLPCVAIAASVPTVPADLALVC